MLVCDLCVRFGRPPRPRSGSLNAFDRLDAVVDAHLRSEAPRRIAAIVPAHNEEDHLAACLDSLKRAAGRCALPVDVVVVLDSCQDRTAAIAAAAVPGPLHRLTLLVADVCNVGRARDTGARWAVGAYGAPGLWLASTDADSEVPADWFTRQLRHAHRGAEAVLGTVAVTDWSRHTPIVGHRYRAAYNPRPGHRHVHGANLALTASAYLAVDGFPPMVAHEDVALVDRLTRSGFRIARAGDLPVVTSARPVGRAPAGFAGYLHRLAPSATAQAGSVRPAAGRASWLSPPAGWRSSSRRVPTSCRCPARAGPGSAGRSWRRWRRRTSRW